jgi:hypothetical protein
MLMLVGPRTGIDDRAPLDSGQGQRSSAGQRLCRCNRFAMLQLLLLLLLLLLLRLLLLQCIADNVAGAWKSLLLCNIHKTEESHCQLKAHFVIHRT